MRLLVTGGCGFIGSNFIRHVLRARRSVSVVNLDALTYAGNRDNLRDLEGRKRYTFVKGSITDARVVDRIARRGLDAIVNFAAESHVDRSLYGPVDFARTNLEGVVVLMEAARRRGIRRFVQISTDEVYGALPPEGIFTEETPLHPNNPYSATKAAADLMVEACVRTFGQDALITRSSNNYGPYQHPEKLECPLYGDGLHVRDWLHVRDNCAGILAVLEKGRTGQVYNLGGGNERPNLEVALELLRLLGGNESLLKFVTDRPGHDRRYAIDSSKARRELGWEPKIPLEEGLQQAVRWYRANPEWIRRARGASYRSHFRKHYRGVSSGRRRRS
jgi:dTDP-glucose 4,6-dehydratase